MFIFCISYLLPQDLPALQGQRQIQWLYYNMKQATENFQDSFV